MPKGGQRKPSKVKQMEGNRSKVAQSVIVIDPPGKGRPKMPPDLSDLEQEMWVDVVASLPSGLLTNADNAVLERFVTAWARFRAARRLIAETGILVQTKMGIQRNPALVVLNNASREMHMAGGEIGLSPVARARLASAEHPWDDDPMAQLLGDDEDGAWRTGRAN